MKLEEYFNITGTYELKNGLYNVKGDVELIKQVEKLPVKFGNVSGTFDCFDNELTSLEGSPKSVGGTFDCGNNYLTSLEGCPKSVGGDFFCDNNNLNSIEGCPKSVGGNFDCDYNDLTSLEGYPKSVGGYLNCDEKLYDTKEYKQFLILEKLRN